MVVSSVLVSGIVINVGSALFLCAAFTPISFRVFTEKSATRKLKAIRASPTAWSVTQILFGLGALVTAIGIGLLAYALRRQSSAWLIWVSVAVLVPRRSCGFGTCTDARWILLPSQRADGPAGPCWRTSC